MSLISLAGSLFVGSGGFASADFHGTGHCFFLPDTPWKSRWKREVEDFGGEWGEGGVPRRDRLKHVRWHRLPIPR